MSWRPRAYLEFSLFFVAGLAIVVGAAQGSICKCRTPNVRIL